MKESLRLDIERASQAMVCAILLDQLDHDGAINFNSFTIDERDESGALQPMAIVTVQRPGMKSPIELYHEACAENDALRTEIGRLTRVARFAKKLAEAPPEWREFFEAP